MNIEAFEAKCPECGKKVYVYSAKRSVFCSRMCESNFKYRSRFDSAPDEQRPTFDEVRRFGVQNLPDKK